MNQPPHRIDDEWRTTDGTALRGTLQLPHRAHEHERVPAVLLISGSGPLDRDSNTDSQAFNVTSTIADHLATRGIASLRFDKRGTGASGPDYTTTSFYTEYEDTAATLRHLATLQDVDANHIGVIGHSVGATFAIRLAATEPAVSAAVLLAAAATPGEHVMEWQSDQIGQTLPGPDWLTGRIFRAIQRRNRTKLTQHKTTPSSTSGAPISGQWLSEYIAHDPAHDLPHLACPVLAITGGKDLQVNPADLATIAALVTGPCQAETPPDLTHILRTTPDRPSISQYRKLLDAPVDQSLLASVSDWLTSTLHH